MPKFQERRFTAGQTIYQEDTGGDRFYVVESGVVDIFARHGSSELMDLAPKKQGEFFGDQALFDAAHIRSTTAVAASDCLLLELRRDKFDKYLLSAAPGMRKKIQSIICVDMTDVLVNIEFLKGVSHEYVMRVGCSSPGLFTLMLTACFFHPTETCSCSARCSTM